MEPPSPPPSEETACTFGQCFCRWRTSRCSPRIPLVAPGMDYECMPAGADDRAAWSLLVGFISSISPGNSSLRLHRFRVARSGRVLGRSGDALEIFSDVDYDGKDASSHIFDIAATPSPNGCSLCIFSKERRIADVEHIRRPRPLQLHLNLRSSSSPRVLVSPHPFLPTELEPVMPTRPISAAGHLWAPYLTKHRGPSRLVMLWLDEHARRWVGVAAINLPQKKRQLPGILAGRVLQGYAVVGRTILLSLLPSLQPDHLFFAFDCSTCVLTDVAITEADKSRYTPIHGRGIYVEEDDTIYFLDGGFVCAYKLCREQHQYSMAPPTKVDCLCPFREEGYGFLTYLGFRVMCAVWIGVSFRCSCNSLHVMITTFEVTGSNQYTFIPEQVKILHSTCRQLDMSPSKPNYSEFCFLQEYDDFDHATAIPPQKRLKHQAMAPSMVLQGMYVGTSSSVVTRTCCRKILNGITYSPSVMLDDSAIQINKALYFVCQDSSCSDVYKIAILDGRLSCQGKTLTPHYTFKAFISDDKYESMKHPLSCHFVCVSRQIYAVPSKENEIHSFDLHSGTFTASQTRKPDDFCSIALVLNLGNKVIALSDSLEYVYYLKDPNTWMQQTVHGSVDLKRKVNLSGYLIMDEDSFIVCDADTGFCFLFDLVRARCTPVFPSYCSRSELLSGRSVYVEGFIYTCTDGGLAAYELTEQGGSYNLGEEIKLPFSWHMFWESDRMCFDYVGKDTIFDALMFCVVQGGDYGRHGSSPPICITTVQVKTICTDEGKSKPLIVGHVDIVTSFIKCNSRNIWTSFCFIPLEKKNASSKKGRQPKESCAPTEPPARCSISSVHQSTLKISCKAHEGYCLAIYDCTLVLAPFNSRDERQHWFRDTRLSTVVNDEEGNPVFSLVNKATDLAIKHSLGPDHPVRLVKFNPDNYDESLLWTESCDLGKDYGCIRMIHGINLCLDALGPEIVLSEWAESSTQSWKILYWDDEANATCGGLYTKPSCRIYSKANEDFSVTVCNGAVCLGPTNPADKYQHWIVDTRYENKIKDEEGYSAFALVNRFTGEAIKCSDHDVELVPYNPNYLNKSVLWTEGCDVGNGFQCIRVLDNIKLNFHALLGDKNHQGIVLERLLRCDNQHWKIVHWCKSHNPNRPAYT